MGSGKREAGSGVTITAICRTPLWQSYKSASESKAEVRCCAYPVSLNVSGCGLFWPVGGTHAQK